MGRNGFNLEGQKHLQTKEETISGALKGVGQELKMLITIPNLPYPQQLQSYSVNRVKHCIPKMLSEDLLQ